MTDITARISESRRLLETLSQARRQIDTCCGTIGIPCFVCDAARDRIRMAKTKLTEQIAALLDVVEAASVAMQDPGNPDLEPLEEAIAAYARAGGSK